MIYSPGVMECGLTVLLMKWQQLVIVMWMFLCHCFNTSSLCSWNSQSCLERTPPLIWNSKAAESCLAPFSPLPPLFHIIPHVQALPVQTSSLCSKLLPHVNSWSLLFCSCPSCQVMFSWDCVSCVPVFIQLLEGGDRGGPYKRGTRLEACSTNCTVHPERKQEITVTITEALN